MMTTWQQTTQTMVCGPDTHTHTDTHTQPLMPFDMSASRQQKHFNESSCGKPVWVKDGRVCVCVCVCCATCAEYLRSVSKPSSRSASQNLGEFPKSGARSQGGEDEQQPGLEGWSFAQPKQIPPPTTHSRKRSPHIDPQLSVSPPSASKCGAAPASTSCISEPSTTTVTSYNTCLPAGLLGVALGSSSSSVPQLSVEAPESPATSASPPATAREELKAAPKPIVTKAGAGTRGEVQMSDLRVQDVDSKAGVGAATSSPAGTSPREQPAAGTEQATGT